MSTLSLTLALGRVGGQRHAPAVLPSGKITGTGGQSGREKKISPPPGFQHVTVQAVASRYADWAISAAKLSMQ